MQQNTSGYYQTLDGHELFWRVFGNPEGAPVILLHGGPGCGMDEYVADYFDLSKTRVLMFDQRGCGQSKPLGCLDNNTTIDLVEDIEALRRYHKFEKPMICGGSWGSALALEYTKIYPECVSKLVLNSIFLGRDQDEDWFLQQAGMIRPEAWGQLTCDFNEGEKDNVGQTLFSRMFSDDVDMVRETTARFANYMSVLLKLQPNEAQALQPSDVTERHIAGLRIFLHYSSNHYFMKAGLGALQGLDRIGDTPLHIVHGRYDLDAPVIQAYDLHQAVSGSVLEVLPLCGHSDTEDQMAAALKKLYQIS